MRWRGCKRSYMSVVYYLSLEIRQPPLLVLKTATTRPSRQTAKPGLGAAAGGFCMAGDTGVLCSVWVETCEKRCNRKHSEEVCNMWSESRKYGRFRKIAKSGLLASSYLSVRVSPHGGTRLPLDGFGWNLILEPSFFFSSSSEICLGNSRFIKIWQ